MQMSHHRLHIGTAGWSIPPHVRASFPPGNSLLEQYSQIFNAVEINSSFYKSHQKTTYERWAATTPPDFQFSIKIPKQVTHYNRLMNSEGHLDSFIKEVSGLNEKLGPLLIQLPPSLSFTSNAIIFFKALRDRFQGKVVLEPRHASWDNLEALQLLQVYHIERVITDSLKALKKPKSEQLFKYYRLHGSPAVYSSSYDAAFLTQLAQDINDSSWVIFDNTRLGAATKNAMDLISIFRKNTAP